MRMNTIPDRIRAARVLRGWSQAKLAEACGWSASRIGNYEQGSREPGITDLEVIGDAMWIASSWLLTGGISPTEGGRYRVLSPGILAVEEYPTGHRQAGKRSPFRLDALDGRQVSERASIKEEASPPYARTLRPISTWDRPEDLPHDEFGFLQHLDAYLSAGNGGPSADMIERTDKATPFRSDWLRAKGWSPRTHYTMRCRGDSMEPTIQDGAPVVVDTSEAGRRVQSGRVYAIAVDGELLLKRLDRMPGGLLRIRSDNASPLYPSLDLPEESISVIGRAVWTPVNL